MLEPIDDVKAQVQINTNTMVQIKNTLDILMKETAEAMERDKMILTAIQDLKDDMKRKHASGSSYRNYQPKNMSNLIKEFVVKFEGTVTPSEKDQSEA